MGGHIGTIWRIRLNLCTVQPGEFDLICASLGKLGPPESATQMANRSLQTFFHSSQQKFPILYSGRPFPPKLSLPMGDVYLHLTRGSLCPPDFSTQTASRLVEPFLQGSLMWQTDTPTDHATRSVTIGHTYICSKRCDLIITATAHPQFKHFWANATLTKGAAGVSTPCNVCSAFQWRTLTPAPQISLPQAFLPIT